MKIFAISDLHMSGGTDKPMDVFGGNWTDHLSRIRKDWENRVGEDDVVLLTGDLSWAMELPNALPDIAWLGSLPGKKIIIRGNHDYWWKSISRIRDQLPNGVYALQNDAVKIGNAVFCGSRGWTAEGSPDFTEQDQKILLREQERMRLALNSAKKLQEEGDELYVLIHYPPFNVWRQDSVLTKLYEESGVTAVVYGHLHGKDSRADLVLQKNSVGYYLTSCDLLGHTLAQIK